MISSTNYSLVVSKTGCSNLNTNVIVTSGQNTNTSDLLMTCSGTPPPPPVESSSGGLLIIGVLGVGAIILLSSLGGRK